MYVNKISGPLVVKQSTFSIFKSVKAGSFLYSRDPDFGLLAESSLFECSNVNYDWRWDQSQVTSITMSNQGGAFHIENSLFVNPSVLNGNVFRNCYVCHQGGVFTLINSKLFDTSSKYNQNSAIEGGVFKCVNC